MKQIGVIVIHDELLKKHQHSQHHLNLYAKQGNKKICESKTQNIQIPYTPQNAKFIVHSKYCQRRKRYWRI